MTIYSLIPQHELTEEQIAQGAVEVDDELKEKLLKNLTFTFVPSQQILTSRALWITKLFADYCKQNGIVLPTETLDNLPEVKVLISGAPFFMSALEQALRESGFSPVYSFSERKSVEREVNGEVVKTSVFKHVKFIPAWRGYNV